MAVFANILPIGGVVLQSESVETLLLGQGNTQPVRHDY
jgi:hypothetical protein